MGVEKAIDRIKTKSSHIIRSDPYLIQDFEQSHTDIVLFVPTDAAWEWFDDDFPLAERLTCDMDRINQCSERQAALRYELIQANVYEGLSVPLNRAHMTIGGVVQKYLEDADEQYGTSENTLIYQHIHPRLFSNRAIDCDHYDNATIYNMEKVFIPEYLVDTLEDFKEMCECKDEAKRAHREDRFRFYHQSF